MSMIFTGPPAVGKSTLAPAVAAALGRPFVDLDAAIKAGITVAEVTYSNSISVAEHAVMQILMLVRNFVPCHEWVINGGWNIADCVSRAYDLEGLDVGVIAAGRIGQAVLRRLAPFDVRLHYFDTRRLPAAVEEELGLTYHPDVRSLVGAVDIVDIHAPLHPQTYHLFDADLIGTMRRGSYIVNTARAEIVVRDAIVQALESGRLAGYAGDVWFPQPAPVDHPWRTMKHEAMTPHVSGTTLSAQARYAAGTREILEDFFAGRDIRDEYLIVHTAAWPAPARSPTPPTVQGARAATPGSELTARPGCRCPRLPCRAWLSLPSIPWSRTRNTGRPPTRSRASCAPAPHSKWSANTNPPVTNRLPSKNWNDGSIPASATSCCSAPPAPANPRPRPG